MQTQLHKNKDPARIRIEPQKQDTIQKKTDDPHKNPFQRALEPPKSNPFLHALKPQQGVDRPKQVISTPDTSIQQVENRLQDKSTDTAFHTYKKHDPADGKLVIFINGFWGFPTSAKGGGTEKYWGSSWVLKVQDRFGGDYNTRYYDGSKNIGGSGWMGLTRNLSASARKWDGYQKGKDEAANIIASLRKDNYGNIIESVKFVTNSMGAAYQRGFSEALMEYAKKNGWDKKGFQIETVIDVAAYQGSHLGVDPNAQYSYFMRSIFDPVAGYNASKIDGAIELGLDKSLYAKDHEQDVFMNVYHNGQVMSHMKVGTTTNLPLQDVKLLNKGFYKQLGGTGFPGHALEIHNAMLFGNDYLDQIPLSGKNSDLPRGTPPAYEDKN